MALHFFQVKNMKSRVPSLLRYHLSKLHCYFPIISFSWLGTKIIQWYSLMRSQITWNSIGKTHWNRGFGWTLELVIFSSRQAKPYLFPRNWTEIFLRGSVFFFFLIGLDLYTPLVRNRRGGAKISRGLLWMFYRSL